MWREKCHQLTELVLTVGIFSGNLFLVVGAIFGSVWGILGGLTVNIPPFHEESYVDHERTQIRAQSLIHLNPLTLLLYNSLLLLVTSSTGLIAVFNDGLLPHFIHLITVVTAVGADGLSSYSIYWDSTVMQKMFQSMETTMQNYGQNVPRNVILMWNDTEYWDWLQVSRDCCGWWGHQDWTETPFYHQFNKSYPDSCCNETRHLCGHEYGWGNMRQELGDKRTKIKYRACLSTFPKILTTDFHQYSFIARIFGIVLISCACGSIFFQILIMYRPSHFSSTYKMENVTSTSSVEMHSDSDQGSKGKPIFKPNVKNSYKCLSQDIPTVPVPWEGGDFTNRIRRIHQSDSRYDVQKLATRGSKRSTISNFLFPTTSSLRSYVRSIFQRHEKVEPDFQHARHVSDHSSDFKPESVYTTHEGIEEPEVVVSLDLKETGGGEIVVPSIVSLQRYTSTRIYRNELKSKISLRKNSSILEAEIQESEVSRSSKLLRIGSPSQNFIRPQTDGDSSLETIFKSSSFELRCGSTPRLNSLEGICISPSDESVDVILNPIFKDSSSASKSPSRTSNTE